MENYPETRESLLTLLGDANNRDAWEQFAQIYSPLIYRMARQRGLQHSDAQDLTQTVLFSVASSIDRWEKKDDSVRFRHWLRKVASTAIINALSRKPKVCAVGGSSVQRLLDQLPVFDSVTDAQIQLEYRRELFLQAAEIVQSDVEEKTWQAFELTVVKGFEISDAARFLSTSIGSIYASRSRIMKRLSSAVKKLERAEE